MTSHGSACINSRAGWIKVNDSLMWKVRFLFRVVELVSLIHTSFYTSVAMNSAEYVMNFSILHCNIKLQALWKMSVTCLAL